MPFILRFSFRLFSFTVVINGILKIHNQVELTKLVAVVQNARKYHGYEYTRSTTTGAIGVVRNSTSDETEEEMDMEIQRADQNSLIAIDARIALLKDAIVNYHPPSA